LTIPADTSDEELEAYRGKVEDEMNRNLTDADIRLGKEPIEPAEIAS